MHSLVNIIILIIASVAWSAQAAPDSNTLRNDPRELPLMNGSGLECDTSATAAQLLASAREMFVADNYALAEQLYRCALAKDPADVSTTLELSVVYETAGYLEHALAMAVRASKLRPFDEEIIQRKSSLQSRISRGLETEADDLLARSMYKQALPKLTSLLDLRPDDPELFYRRARCYLGMGDGPGAIVEIDKASAIRFDIRYSVLRSHALKLGRSKDTDGLVKEAKALLSTGGAQDRERALAILSQILTRDPEHDWAKKQFVSLGNRQALNPVEKEKPHRRFDFASLAKTAAGYAGNAGVLVNGVWKSVQGHLPLVIIAFLVLVVFASPLASAIARGIPLQTPLAGRLDEYHIQEVLSLIHSQGKNGLLRVRSKSVKARVYFVAGEIYHCASGKKRGQEAIRDVLTRAKDGHFVMAKLPRTFERTIDVPFSLVLMDVGDRSFLDRNPAQAVTESQKKSRMKSLLEGKPDSRN